MVIEVTLAVIGAQWGDEGKGKVVDFYAKDADIVVRFGGGNNAGHTVVVGSERFALHLLPSGVVYGRRLLLGNGVVIDPSVLLSEIDSLAKRGISVNLGISERAHIIFPYHRQLDELQEKLKGKYAAGTTKRGIGPCYADKVARFGIRVCDLVDEQLFKEKLSFLYPLWEKTLAVFGEKPAVPFDTLFNDYRSYAVRLAPYVTDVSAELTQALAQKKKIVFEGAQATMLDIDHGLYPYGTSSNTTVGGILTGCGVGARAVKHVLLVSKAYTTRVGEGPLPTELTDSIGQRIREKGREYGTTTGRPRRCGWIDLVTLRYAKQVNGATGLAIMKVDVLSGIESLNICTAYEYQGKILETPPASLSAFQKCTPIYETMDGWEELPPETWREIAKKGFSHLPAQCRSYLRTIAKRVGLPLTLVSVGPERDETIVLRKVW